jgi:glycogen debranching enzyme
VLRKSSSRESQHKAKSGKNTRSKPSTFRPKGARGRPTNIANAVVIKDADVFVLCQNDAGLPLNDDQGFGLYYHDCRFLKGYEVSIGKSRLNALASSAAPGYQAEFELTNRDVGSSPEIRIKKQSVGFNWQRIVQGSKLSVHDVIKCTNYTVEPVEFVLTFMFEAGFEDIFEIRGADPSKIGKKRTPKWHRDTLVFSYDGADGLRRTVAISISSHSIKVRRRNGADVSVRLEARQSKDIKVSIRIDEASKNESTPPPSAPSLDAKTLSKSLQQNSDDWLHDHCHLQSSSNTLNHLFERSIRDLGALRTILHGEEYFSAGLPWYGTLFGRDSILSSLQTLAFRPAIALQTLRLMAKYQGKEVNDWRDEQPGKIMHELRVGEMAHLNEIPQTPYYGSVDSTPLFLILVAQHANWTGDLSLFRELKPSVEHALDWITRYGDETGDGYLQYSSKSDKGLGNQGWKDSGDSIVNSDGTLAEPPIALVEVQGYVYLAKVSLAEIYERDGDRSAARRLRAEARELQARFERDFWLADKNIYALALQCGKRPAEVVSSNAGQALWSGIARVDRARPAVKQLMSESMFSGWGVRTLSAHELRFNPVGYHLGTVWPHDNSIILAGMRNYGCDGEACAIFSGILQAAKHFEHFRLPEVFAGFSRKESAIPVRYPIACHPQAWAAGSVPFMIESLLGLVPKAFENRLQIVRPALPDFINQLELKRLRVGKSSVDLKFERKADGTVHTRVVQLQGRLEVEVSEGQNLAAA